LVHIALDADQKISRKQTNPCYEASDCDASQAGYCRHSDIPLHVWLDGRDDELTHIFLDTTAK